MLMRFTNLNLCQFGGCENIYTELLFTARQSLTYAPVLSLVPPHGDIAQCAPSPPSPIVLVSQRCWLLLVG